MFRQIIDLIILLIVLARKVIMIIMDNYLIVINAPKNAYLGKNKLYYFMIIYIFILFLVLIEIFAKYVIKIWIEFYKMVIVYAKKGLKVEKIV